MSPTDDDALPDLLAAYDEALAEGRAASFAATLEIPTGLRERWQQVQSCLDRLEAVWGGSARSGLPLLGAFLPPLTQLGRFTLQRELGRGSFGIVYLAHDPLLQRDVAVKVPRLDTVLQPELRQRFELEARAAGSLDHPHIVPVYEAGSVATVCYIVSAYCQGVTLAAWLRQQPLPAFPATAKLVQDLALAIQHAHERGILHRDLKPANVLLQMQAGGDLPAATPKITDFGLAKLLEEASELTHSSMILGTPSYMAPEQASGRVRQVGPPTDVYALGAILYEMLTGRLPFLGGSMLETLDLVRTTETTPPRQFRPEVPIDLETICLKCLRKEPADRYATAQALADDLTRWREQQPILARPVRWPDHLARWCRQPARVREAGLATVVINTVVALWVLGNIILIPSFFPGAFTAFLIESAVVGGFHLVLVWIGKRIMDGNVLALRINVVVSALLALSPFLGLFGLPAPFSEFYAQYPLLRWLIFGLLIIVFTAQLILNLAALIAHRAEDL